MPVVVNMVVVIQTVTNIHSNESSVLSPILQSIAVAEHIVMKVISTLVYCCVLCNAETMYATVGV